MYPLFYATVNMIMASITDYLGIFGDDFFEEARDRSKNFRQRQRL
jgi:hypothetical protein